MRPARQLVLGPLLAVGGIFLVGGYGDGPVQDGPPPVETTPSTMLGIPKRMLDLNSLGTNAAGGPSAFVQEDGGLRVDCDSPTIWCDDEGS